MGQGGEDAECLNIVPESVGWFAPASLDSLPLHFNLFLRRRRVCQGRNFATYVLLVMAYLTLSTYQFGDHGTFPAHIVGPLSWEQHMLPPEVQPKSSSFRETSENVLLVCY